VVVLLRVVVVEARLNARVMRTAHVSGKGAVGIVICGICACQDTGQ